MQLSEQQTRAQLIDRALAQAGWRVTDRDRVGIEIPVDGYNREPWNGITDYCLYNARGEVLAVVEAKKRTRSPRDADEQLRHYVTEIAKQQSFAPFGFMTNGKELHFWEVGLANPRRVGSFFALEDLERLLFIRQNQTPLQAAAIDTKIADRAYQHEAVRRVVEAFARGKRRALLVMATGTGKTRTTMALVDLFFRTSQAQNVLFLADRDALVDQALKEGFQIYLPHEPSTRIYTQNVDKTNRLFVATQQTMSVCYEKFTAGFFDLIIYDEAHRSIFNRFRDVIDYFDARMIGLTATPANFIERDTFLIFDCADQTPTFLYTYKEAVKAGYLVDFSLYKANTGFQRKGIRGVDLAEEERNALIEQGIDPDDLDYSGTDLEKKVTNTDTLRKQWEEVMEVALKDRSGQLPGKTIVFAMTKAHAERIRDVFEKAYPQYVNMTQVITSSTERVRDGSYGDGLITKFKKNDLPRIAISVDMLDTGLDVPEVVNLVFMKPVQSRIKLWQMIGRGTRSQEACHYFDRLPQGRKTEFKVIDFWENDFDKQADAKVSPNMPVLVSIWNNRLKLLTFYLDQQATPECQQVVADLRAQLALIPTDAYSVQKVFYDVEMAWAESFWQRMTADKIKFLQIQVGPLLRFAPGVDVEAATFTNKIERLKLQILKGDASPDLLNSIAEDVDRLPDFIRQEPKYQASVELCLSTALATATPTALTQTIQDLAPQMKNRRDRPSDFRALDLPDFIAARGYISLGEGGEQVYVAEYRRRVESRVLDLIANDPTLEAISRGLNVTDLQLAALERTLRQALSGGDIMLTNSNISKAYGWKVSSFLEFLRHLLELDALPDYATVVKHSFDAHVAAHQYNGDQIRFLIAVQSIFLERRKLEVADLYEGPLLNFGRNAVDRLFTPGEVHDLIDLTGQLAA